MRRIAQHRLATTILLAAMAVSPALPDANCPDGGTGPRTLVLALDGVPLRVIQEARARGAFIGWPEPAPLVSTFPSLTNVAFSAMFQPFECEAANGYEVQYYDPERNKVVGARPWNYSDRVFPWRETFDVTGTTVRGKMAVYSRPRKTALHEFEQAEALLMESDQSLVLAHLGATDGLMHLRGDEKTVRLVVDLAGRLEDLKRRELERTGRELRVVMLSDHGNTHRKTRKAMSLRKQLKKAGLRPWPRLENENDVIAATFGIVNYGTLVTFPDKAEVAARAIAEHKHVQLASWVSDERTVSVVAHGRTARIRWRETPGGRRFRYEAIEGDPLRLSDVVSALQSAGRLDARGYAGARDWLTFSIDSEYPDAPRRLVDGLTGDFVENNGTVLFSLEPGYAWGWKTAYAGSFVWGGLIEGTHGGLDRESSIGFYMADRPGLVGDRALSVNTVLERFADLERCRHTHPTHVAGTADGSSDDPPGR
jgi:hypothetical protein